MSSNLVLPFGSVSPRTHHNNFSHLRSDLQDALCVLSTRDLYSFRKLCTDNEKSVIDVSGPCFINGIGEIATAQGLIDQILNSPGWDDGDVK